MNFVADACSTVLAEDAIRSAIRDYRTKRSNLSDPKQPGFIDVSQNPVTGETATSAHPAASPSASS